MSEQRPQQEPSRPDPFEMWRQYYEANEQIWTKTMKDVMTSQGYAEAQGKMLEIFLSYQKVLREAMSAQLNTLNLPTRDDVSRLGELVVALEEKVDQLGDDVDRLEEQVGELVKSAVTREKALDRMEQRLASLEEKAAPLAGLDGKVSRIETRLGTLANRLGRSGATSEEAESENGKPAAAPPRRSPRSRSTAAPRTD